MKTAVFLYNPESGKGKIARNVGCISTIFQAYGYDVTPQKIDFTANPFDGNETIDLMVVAGGDGTVNYVVNAMKRKGLDIPIGVIPAGTANDFAGAVGMSREPLEAARQIASGVVERVDCGRVNDLYFVNISRPPRSARPTSASTRSANWPISSRGSRSSARCTPCRWRSRPTASDSTCGR